MGFQSELSVERSARPHRRSGYHTLMRSLFLSREHLPDNLVLGNFLGKRYKSTTWNSPPLWRGRSLSIPSLWKEGILSLGTLWRGGKEKGGIASIRGYPVGWLGVWAEKPV